MKEVDKIFGKWIEDYIKDVLKDAGKDFADGGTIKHAIEMVQHLYPDSHSFSKRYILSVLEDYQKAVEKWFEK